MNLRQRSSCIKYSSDSDELKASQSSSSGPESIVVVNTRKRKVQVSRSKVSPNSKKVAKAGALLRYTQPNVTNTNAASCISPRRVDMVQDSEDDDDFVERPASSRKASMKGSSAQTGNLEARRNSSRLVRRSYKEASSSSESEFRDGGDSPTRFQEAVQEIAENSSDGEDGPPDFASFAFKSSKETPAQRVDVPGTRRLTKLASSSLITKVLPGACADLEDDMNDSTKPEKPTYTSGREVYRRRCAPKTLTESRDSDSELSTEEQPKKATEKGKAKLARKNDKIAPSLKREVLRRACAPKSILEIESSDCESEPVRNTTKSEQASGIGQGNSRSTPGQQDIPLKLEVDAFGLLLGKDHARSDVVKRVSHIEKILSVRRRNTEDAIYCVKESGKSYRKVVLVKEVLLMQKNPQLLRNFWKRMDDLGRVDGNPGERENGPAFNPLYVKVDRIIGEEHRGRKDYYFVKWCGLAYSEATWELKEDLAGDKAAIDRYLWIHSYASTMPPSTNEVLFKDGRVLRDYQEKGLAWMDHNFQSRVNCILADEMGLGKTMQAVSMLQNLRVKRRVRGPFLVIAPVSTLGHWQREIESLTDMNCVTYCGSAEDRDIIKQYEIFIPKSQKIKFHVLLTSFEIMMKDQSFLSKHEWRYLVVDEAHRLKSKDSKTTRALKQLQVRKGGLLLLTGTPVQNNTKEIFSLLSVLDPERFGDEEDFLLKYGDLQNAEQVKDLQEILKPRLLRRMKEDVEKSIPQKEETIIWVELTKEQRCYYRAILENRIADLLKGSQTSNIPNLRNVAMELRKLCNHPFLCNGLQEDLNLKLPTEEGSQKALCQASGKMMLLDKLLPMLKNAGHRVLIFSQFAIMLDLLEDYLVVKNYSYERIDGTIRGSDRQAAIDRYSETGSDTFVFLLSTRAGGLGITLTAADTCIIYDSDWNPQNDLQAMARCHRIGQTKDVRIYRLITRNTYEQHLFECSSRKYGLDEAILGSMQAVSHDSDHNKNIESLLRRGAYDILKEDGEAEAAAFHAQNIEQILESRTEKRLIGGRGNNSFSVATFISNPEADSLGSNPVPDLDDSTSQFWQELLPEACNSALHPDKQDLVVPCGPRRRTRVNYRERHVASDVESSDEEYERSEGKNRSTKRKNVQGQEDQDGVKQWSEKDLKRLENRLIQLGPDRAEQIVAEAGLEHYGLDETQQLCKVVVQLCQHFQAKNVQGNDVHAATLNENSRADVEDENLGKNSRLSAIHSSPPQQQANSWNARTFASSGNINSTEIAEVPKDSHVTVPSKEASDKNTVGKAEMPLIPPFAQKAMNSPGFMSRLQKNASRYLQTIHEREELAKAFSNGRTLPPYVPRTKKLPDWWGEAEDLDLMVGAHKHGHRDFHKLRQDKSLRFASILESLGSKHDDNPINGDNSINPINGDNPINKEQERGWPTDAVLMLRLKKLIHALSYDYLEIERQKKEAMKEAARRRALEWRATKEREELETPLSDELRKWSPSKQLSSRFMTEAARQERTLGDFSLKIKKEAKAARNQSSGLFRPLIPNTTKLNDGFDQKHNPHDGMEVPNSSSDSEINGFPRTTNFKKTSNLGKLHSSLLRKHAVAPMNSVPPLTSTIKDYGSKPPPLDQMQSPAVSTARRTSKEPIATTTAKENETTVLSSLCSDRMLGKDNSCPHPKNGGSGFPCKMPSDYRPFRHPGKENASAGPVHALPLPSNQSTHSKPNGDDRRPLAQKTSLPSVSTKFSNTLKLDHAAPLLQKEKESDVLKRRASSDASLASKKPKGEVSKQQTLLGFLASRSSPKPGLVNGKTVISQITPDIVVLP